MSATAQPVLGAMLVGSIAWTVKEGERFDKAGEMGYFACASSTNCWHASMLTIRTDGGSTVICAFPASKVAFDEDLLKHSREPIEVQVRVAFSCSCYAPTPVRPGQGRRAHRQVHLTAPCACSLSVPSVVGTLQYLCIPRKRAPFGRGDRRLLRVSLLAMLSKCLSAAAPAARSLSVASRAKHTLPDLPYDYNVRRRHRPANGLAAVGLALCACA